MKNEIKNTKLKLPIELISDLILFIPFNIKWIKIRISKIFDLFIIKYQRKWIISLILLQDSASQQVDGILELLNAMKTEDLAESSMAKHTISDLNSRFNGVYGQFQDIGKVVHSLRDEINSQVEKIDWPGVDKSYYDVAKVKENFVAKKAVIVKHFEYLKGEVKTINSCTELDSLATALRMIFGAVERISTIYV
ncbi:hypothetical protein ACQ4LE_009408 [Meloidogyne hapla]